MEDEEITLDKQYKKRNLWGDNSESLLINVWKSNALKLRLVRRNNHIVDKMAEELQKLGVTCTPAEVYNKMHNLTSRYRREKKMMVQTGGIPSDWPPFKEMHKIMTLYESHNDENCAEENLSCVSNELTMYVDISDTSKVRCSDLKKCGEIATLLSVGKSEFFLNSGFCEFTFLQLDNFIQHVYKEHLSEFARLDVTEGEYDIEQILEGEYDPVPLAVNAEEIYDDIRSELNDFETIEIELDTASTPSLDIKEGIERRYSYKQVSQVDKFEEGQKSIKPKHISKSNEIRLHTHQNKRETSEKQKFGTHESTDESDLLVEMGITKTDSDMDYENEIEAILNHSLNEVEQISNYEENENYDLVNDDDQTDSASKFVASWKLVNKLENNAKETQLTSDSILKEMKTVTRVILDGTQYATLSSTYKQYRCLWDETHIAYRFKNRREEALKSLQQEFNNKSGLNLNEHDLQYEIKKLRKRCSLEKQAKIKCKRRKLVFQPKCPYYNDIEYLEIDVPPFECTTCRKLLPGLSQYKIHTASHDGTLPFKCNLCKQAFKLSQNLEVHQRRHAQDYTHICEVCNKACATSIEKKIHMRSHTGEKPFVCYICGHKFTTSSHLLVHVRRHQKRPRYKCQLCPKMYYETGELNEHMTRHRNIRDSICDICNKGFTSMKLLRQHRLIHNAEKRYTCQICDKQFAQHAGLCCHMKSHGRRIDSKLKN